MPRVSIRGTGPVSVLVLAAFAIASAADAAEVGKSIDARPKTFKSRPTGDGRPSKMAPTAKDPVSHSRPRRRNMDGTIDRIPQEGGVCEVAPPCPSWCELDFRSNSCAERQTIKLP